MWGQCASLPASSCVVQFLQTSIKKTSVLLMDTADPIALYCPEVEKPALRTPRQDPSLEKQEFLLLSWDMPCGLGEASFLNYCSCGKRGGRCFLKAQSLSNMRCGLEDDEGISKAS